MTENRGWQPITGRRPQPRCSISEIAFCSASSINYVTRLYGPVLSDDARYSRLADIVEPRPINAQLTTGNDALGNLVTFCGIKLFAASTDSALRAGSRGSRRGPFADHRALEAGLAAARAERRIGARRRELDAAKRREIA
jgi:hypothetical protein